MNKRELKKMFPYILNGELDYELRHKRNKYKTEKGFLAHLKKVNEENERIATMPDVVRIRIDIEWKRNRTWGWCPRAEYWVSFADGSYDKGTAYASGCGYDKHSTVVAEIFNKCCKGMLWRKRNSRTDAPYGINHAGKNHDKDYMPYFEGGVGISCYPRITKWLGGKWIENGSGKTYDGHIVEFKSK